MGPLVVSALKFGTVWPRRMLKWSQDAIFKVYNLQIPRFTHFSRLYENSGLRALLYPHKTSAACGEAMEESTAQESTIVLQLLESWNVSNTTSASAVKRRQAHMYICTYVFLNSILHFN